VKREERDGGIQLFASTPDLLRFQKADALGFVTSFSYLRNDLTDGQLDGGPSDSFGNVVLEQDRMRPTNRVADGAPGSGQARPRCQPSVPSVICRKGLAASRC